MELAAARADAEDRLALPPEPSAGLAVVTGGSARRVAKIAGPVVAKNELGDALERSLDGKSAVKNRRRRRSLPAGIVILDVLHSAIQQPLTIATGGLREGVLLHLSGVSAIPGTLVRT